MVSLVIWDAIASIMTRLWCEDCIAISLVIVRWKQVSLCMLKLLNKSDNGLSSGGRDQGRDRWYFW